MTSRYEYDRISADFEPYKLNIDGRDLAYRDPNNPDMRKKLMDQSDSEYEANPHAYNMMNPLYDYSYGELRKAGEALNISNVNDKEEVEQMLEYLSKPKTSGEAAMDEQIEEAVSTTPLSDEFAQKGAPLSDDLQADVDLVSKTVDEIRDGTYNDSYRRMAGVFGGSGDNSTFASDALKNEMNAGSGIIDVNEFAKNREIRDTKMEDEFHKKFNKPLFG